MTSKGEQAKNQLIAAAIAQFGEYGQHATTRDIASPGRAEHRRYHLLFWLERRSVSCLRPEWIADFIGDNFRPQAEAAEHLLAGEAPDRQAIRDLILSACHNMILLLTQDDTVNLSKFISREQLAPTAAYHLIHQQVIAPLHHYLTRLIAAWTGCEASDTQMILHTHALLGEVLAFRLGRETILLRTGWTQFDAQKTEQIFEVITCHIDFILHGLSQRSLG